LTPSELLHSRRTHNSPAPSTPSTRRAAALCERHSFKRSTWKLTAQKIFHPFPVTSWKIIQTIGTTGSEYFIAPISFNSLTYSSYRCRKWYRNPSSFKKKMKSFIMDMSAPVSNILPRSIRHLLRLYLWDIFCFLFDWMTFLQFHCLCRTGWWICRIVEEENDCDVSRSENDFITHIFLSVIFKSNKNIVVKFYWCCGPSYGETARHHTFKLVGRFCLTAVHEFTVKFLGNFKFFPERQNPLIRFKKIFTVLLHFFHLI
jgi:hypothetical protein